MSVCYEAVTCCIECCIKVCVALVVRRMRMACSDFTLVVRRMITVMMMDDDLKSVSSALPIRSSVSLEK